MRLLVSLESKGKIPITNSVTEEQLQRLLRIVQATKASRGAVLRHVLDKGLPIVEAEFGISEDDKPER